MKNSKKILLASLIMILALLSIGCDDAKELAKYAGKYKLDSIESTDKEMQDVLFNALKDQTKLELKKDGKGELYMPGAETFKFEWRVDDNKILLETEDSLDELEIKGDKILLEEDGDKLVFKKSK